MEFIKKYTIFIILVSLVVAISYLSYYNYTKQEELLLKQMHSNSINISSSVSSAIERFDDVKSTMNLQKLVNDISFGLDIFEFRYLEADGTIKNSMFKDEIGTILNSKSFIETMQGDREIQTFFYEIRDYVNVMSIYYPIYQDKQLVGIIDLSVDISEYNTKDVRDNFSLIHRQTDVLNLLTAINASIINSLTILTKTDINDFLHAYVSKARSIKQISIIDEYKKVYISSDKLSIGKVLSGENSPVIGMNEINGTLTYLTLVNFNLDNNTKLKLLLLTDASTYANHKEKLLQTAVITSIMALFFALFTSRLIYFTAIAQSRKEQERLEHLVSVRTREIELLSQTDALTGLYNRRHLEETLDKEFKRARRYNHDLSIIMLDLDHFKHINDTYGHMAGDEVLRKVSAIIQSCQRETDFIGRYGGEEIVIVLPETDLKASAQVAETILKSISAQPIEFESKSIYVTTSIGISSIRKMHLDYLMIFAEVDETLYIAKENGRNRIEIYKPESD
ncbi:MAG: GGDEF domain-containing protein [Sulfurimonadaceae bacterium]|jgi:diguanylate cyclase (GGDEF)-like protein|nr:GGDEF domain-containing protein [Sulfurimonadaceae bacterium]